MVKTETNDEEKQQKYEDKISLRTLLLKDIDRVNKALLNFDRAKSLSALKNLVSDLPENIYKSISSELQNFRGGYSDSLEKVKKVRDKEWDGAEFTGSSWKGHREKASVSRWYRNRLDEITEDYVRRCKKLIRWTMDDFGLGLEEEGKKIDEGGLA